MSTGLSDAGAKALAERVLRFVRVAVIPCEKDPRNQGHGPAEDLVRELLSRWCLVAAMAAIGMKTQIRELATIGLKPVLLLLGETAFLASLVLLLLRWSA